MKLLVHILKYFLLIILLLSVLLFFNLDINEKPIKSDVIIALGGQYYRETKAIELLKQGYSKSNKVILSPITQNQKNARPPFTEDLVNRENIIAEPNATSTWTNATESIKVMEKHGWKSAIVVTSDFHTRRSRLAFERAKGDKDLTFNYVSVYPIIKGQEMHYLKYQPNWSWAFREIYKYWGYLIQLYYFIDL